MIFKYLDINYELTAMAGQVILKAGSRVLDNGFELWEVSITVPEKFAREVILWMSEGIAKQNLVKDGSKVIRYYQLKFVKALNILRGVDELRDIDIPSRDELKNYFLGVRDFDWKEMVLENKEEKSRWLAKQFWLVLRKKEFLDMWEVYDRIMNKENDEAYKKFVGSLPGLMIVWAWNSAKYILERE